MRLYYNEEEWDKYFFYNKALSNMVVVFEPECTEHRLQLIDFITVNDQDYLFAHLKGTNASIMVIRAVQTQEGLQLEKVSDPEERRMAWQAWSEMDKKRKEIKETRKTQLDELDDNERPF